MSTLVDTGILQVSVEPGPRRKVWTRAECEALESAGLLEGQKLELIEGELIDKMGKGHLHVEIQHILQRALAVGFGLENIYLESPIDVAPEDNPSSEPEPDLVVLKSNYSRSGSRQPGPSDVCLVVEVSDSTLRWDLNTKARLYARAGIAEYWVVDAVGQRLFVHRDPRSGTYATRVIYAADQSAAPLAAPQALFQVASLFPASAES